MIEFCRLLDAGWIVTTFRGVDRKYFAAARRKHQKWTDVIPQIDVDVDMFNKPTLTRSSPGIPSQCADGSTPEEALKNLADKVVGLTA